MRKQPWYRPAGRLESSSNFVTPQETRDGIRCHSAFCTGNCYVQVEINRYFSCFHRAVYSGNDVIILDDPLSAVDAHVGKTIFFDCIKNLLKGKTVIFVTHQLQYLKDCDQVLLLRDGRIAEIGIHDDLMEDDKEYAALIRYTNADDTNNSTGNLHIKKFCEFAP